MRLFTSSLILVVALAGVGCASQAQFLDNKQGMAMQTAAARVGTGS